MDGRTVKGKINLTGGGVARNVADALGKLSVNPYLISVVGDKQFGNFVLDRSISHLTTKGIVKAEGTSTGICMVMCDHAGECMVIVGDMTIHESIKKDHVMRHEDVIAGSSLVVLDGNLTQETTEFVLTLCHEKSVPVWFEPTDVLKATKPFLNKNVPLPSFISPNFMEFKKIFEVVCPGEVVEEDTDQIEECIIKGYVLAEFIDNIIITLGKKGVMVIRRGEVSDPFFNGDRKKLESEGAISHRIYEPSLIECEEIANVSGAGDCFASGFIAAMLRGESENRCIESGFKCSAASLRCTDPVPARF